MPCDKDFGYVRVTQALTHGHYGDLRGVRNYSESCQWLLESLLESGNQ